MKLVLFAMVLLLISCTAPEVRPPNVVFILADDLGWADLPAYGNRFNEAPYLQRLANEGRLFTNAYAACPVCSPTRASIQTGQYPARLGIIDFLPGHWRPFEKMIPAQNRTQYLPQKMETLGEIMQKAGYKTGYFGKWHLGNQEQNFAKNQGYSESVIFQGSPYFGYNEVLKPNQQFPEDKVLSEALTDLSISFIENNQADPFFLFLAHFDVHVQLDADSAKIVKYLNKPKVSGYPCNAVYAAMVENIDVSVGRILDKLAQLNLDENTIVIFFSDNGGLIRRFDRIPLIAESKSPIYHGDSLLYIASSNAPLRSEKGTLYEGGIREPLIIKWPGKIEPGSQSDAIISSVDFFPSLLDIIGMTTNQVVDGESILPKLTQDRPNDSRNIFWHYPVYHHSVPASAVRSGDWKLIHFYDSAPSELYDLKSDISESNNLAEVNPKKRDELKDLLDTWLAETGADLPRVNPDFDETKRFEWGTHPGRDQLQQGEIIE
ncbi:MAG: sulfatase [Saprospiraceae bacterium]|nr:sulfatase [Saprospiraceae bacterium]